MQFRFREARCRSKRRAPRRAHRRFELLEPRRLLTTLPYGAVPEDTAEYMLGDVVATVVFFESNGTIDVSTEDWNELVRDQHGDPVLDEFGRTISADGPNLIEDTKSRVIEGLDWWEATLDNFYVRMYDDVAPVHSLNFVFDFEYAHNPIDTGYEPISRRSNDYVYWVGDFLDQVGYSQTGWIDSDIRAFNNAQRLKHGADWAFTIFVANDYNDLDGRFAAGGSFSQAFSFSGGRFVVSPARRPASTFAHESGHIFYARDEYEDSGGSYVDRRGYYNSQNWNAWDNPDPDWEQQPSIMDAGSELQIGWDTHVSSDSSLAMVGWQDSDGDGVFDVLDVPLSLSGSGVYDPLLGFYRFVGHSSVNTLPNINSSGRRNDITINEVSQVVYSLDNGASWVVGRNYGKPEASIDFSVRLNPGQEILIRTQTIDPGTGQVVVTSAETFHGSTELPTSVVEPGVQGFVWYDKNDDGVWDPGERGVPGWTVQLVDAVGQPLQLQQILEPDDYAQHDVVNEVLDGVTLSAIGYDTRDNRVGALDATTTSTGDKVLGLVRYGVTDNWTADWTSDSRNLRIDFDVPATALSIDAVSPGADAYGRLEVYDTSGALLGRYTTGLLTSGAAETMSLSTATPQISYAIVRASYQSTIRLDNLRVGPESLLSTSQMGAYSLLHLPPGEYHVQAIPSEDWDVAAPATGIVDVTVASDGKMVWESGSPRPSDFAGLPSPTAPPWRNPINALDVNDDNLISPIDALLIINVLNTAGPHLLPPPSGADVPPPFLDVNGNGFVSALDALLVINFLNERSGEGEFSGFAGSGSGGDSTGEGEATGSVAEATLDLRTEVPLSETVSGWQHTAPLPRVAPVKRVGAAGDLDAVDAPAVERRMQPLLASVDWDWHQDVWGGDRDELIERREPNMTRREQMDDGRRPTPTETTDDGLGALRTPVDGGRDAAVLEQVLTDIADEVARQWRGRGLASDLLDADNGDCGVLAEP